MGAQKGRLRVDCGGVEIRPVLRAELCSQCCYHGPLRPLLTAASPVVVVIGLMSQVLGLVLESSCGRLEDCLPSPNAPAATAGLSSLKTGLGGGVGGGHRPLQQDACDQLVFFFHKLMSALALYPAC